MLNLTHVHLRPDDRFEAHVNDLGTLIVTASSGADDLGLFFADRATARRFAKAVVDGLALLADEPFAHEPVPALPDGPPVCFPTGGGS